jgi:hypothetical protein
MTLQHSLLAGERMKVRGSVHEVPDAGLGKTPHKNRDIFFQI